MEKKEKQLLTINKITEISHKMAEEMYKSAGAQGQAGQSEQKYYNPESGNASAPNSAPQQDVVDADFEVEDDKK